MVKRYHKSFPSSSYEFDSRYPLQSPKMPRRNFYFIVNLIDAHMG